MMRLAVLIGLLGLLAEAAWADKDRYLDLARRGWNYELRTTMVGRDLSIPVLINGRALARSTLCLVGEPPHPQSRAILKAFRTLVEDSFGAPLALRDGGQDARNCGTGSLVILRFYSGFPPNGALSADLNWLNGLYGLGLPAGRDYAASSPAMAQTFFGRKGMGTHLMVKQPAHAQPTPLEAAFHKSILIEELFQTFTFGMDVLLFDRSAGFLSKLQETPFNLYRLPWTSRAFMQGLLASNPDGLCPFDLFMLRAVAQAPVEQTIQRQFLDFIDAEYEALTAEAEIALADPRFALIVNPDCQAPER